MAKVLAVVQWVVPKALVASVLISLQCEYYTLVDFDNLLCLAVPYTVACKDIFILICSGY